jgi:hypothetical protein
MSDEFDKLLRRGEKYKGLKDLAANGEVIEFLDRMVDSYKKQALTLINASNDSRFQALIAMDAFEKIKRMLTSAERLDQINSVNIDKIQNPSKESIKR